MAWRGALAVAVAMVFAALPAMGHARPPDPVWIEGLYDDGDQDDLVALATSTSAVAADPGDWRPLLAPAEQAAPVLDTPRWTPAAPPARPRGPPPR
jgi:hypothetical protein